MSSFFFHPTILAYRQRNVQSSLDTALQICLRCIATSLLTSDTSWLIGEFGPYLLLIRVS